MTGTKRREGHQHRTHLPLLQLQLMAQVGMRGRLPPQWASVVGNQVLAFQLVLGGLSIQVGPMLGVGSLSVGAGLGSDT